jgi:hypothetical protein
MPFGRRRGKWNQNEIYNKDDRKRGTINSSGKSFKMFKDEGG